MTNALRLLLSTFLVVGAISLACSAGETVGTGSSTGNPGAANTTGSSGTTGAGNVTGSSGTTGAGNVTGASGRGGTTGAGNVTGASGRGGTTGTGNVTGASGTTGVGNTTGASGTTGVGNTMGTSGTTGAGNTTGASGSTGTTGVACVLNSAGSTKAPVAALITDFSDTMADASNAGEFRFGGGMLSTRVQGGTSRFKNPASTAGTLSVSGGALTFMASVSAPAASGADQYPYNGFALYLDGPNCTDASAYSAVGFTMTLTGTCSVVFSFAYSETLSSSSDANRGSCTGSCYPSQYMVTAATTSVAFTATPQTMGVPMPMPNKAKLTGVQWQMSSTAACTGSITIDNVKFQ